ncbi:MAG: hypothetical protein JKY61_00520 [Planctomycetes bacterium]|nr:hypothetical protein [Planctomycetota bacterium]
MPKQLVYYSSPGHPIVLEASVVSATLLHVQDRETGEPLELFSVQAIVESTLQIGDATVGTTSFAIKDLAHSVSSPRRNSQVGSDRLYSGSSPATIPAGLVGRKLYLTAEGYIPKSIRWSAESDEKIVELVPSGKLTVGFSGPFVDADSPYKIEVRDSLGNQPIISLIDQASMVFEDVAVGEVKVTVSTVTQLGFREEVASKVFAMGRGEHRTIMFEETDRRDRKLASVALVVDGTGVDIPLGDQVVQVRQSIDGAINNSYLIAPRMLLRNWKQDAGLQVYRGNLGLIPAGDYQLVLPGLGVVQEFEVRGFESIEVRVQIPSMVTVRVWPILPDETSPRTSPGKLVWCYSDARVMREKQLATVIPNPLGLGGMSTLMNPGVSTNCRWENGCWVIQCFPRSIDVVLSPPLFMKETGLPRKLGSGVVHHAVGLGGGDLVLPLSPRGKFVAQIFCASEGSNMVIDSVRQLNCPVASVGPVSGDGVLIQTIFSDDKESMLFEFSEAGSYFVGLQAANGKEPKERRIRVEVKEGVKTIVTVQYL